MNKNTHFIIILATLGVLLVAAPASAEIVSTDYISDALGSPVAATDETGAVRWREHHQPYGRKLLNEPANDEPTGFTGHRFDGDTGLVYMSARYYDPLLGRFMGMDPAAVAAGNPHSFNRYAYANNNPYGFVDPDGRHPVVAAALGAAGYLFMAHGLATANDPGDVALAVVGGGPATQTAGRIGGSVAQKISGWFKKTISSTRGGAKAPAQAVRSVERGETIDGVMGELASRTRATGNEHALVSLRTGDRQIVELGPNGGTLPRKTKRLIAHSHPRGGAASTDDLRTLSRLRSRTPLQSQGHSYIVQMNPLGHSVERFNAPKLDMATLDRMAK